MTTPGAARKYDVVGIARFGDVKSLGTATAAVFDLKTAQSLFDKDGAYDSILVAGRDGVPAADVRKAVAAAVGSSAQVQTAKAHDRFTLEGLEQFISIIRTVLLVFGFVAIFVGAFTIFNTLSITVAQRSREFGLLRMVGATRRQVLGSVLLEALAIGLLASLVGLGVGFGVAKGLDAIFRSMDLALPDAGIVFASADDRRLDARRHAGDARRRPDPGVAGDAGAAGGGAARRRPGRPQGAPARPRRARHGVAHRPPGREGRRLRRRAGPPQRDAPSRPHGRDGVGADDRRRAGHARHRDRAGPARHDDGHAREARSPPRT